MKISQIKTNQRNRVDLEELYAISSAYGKGIRRKEIYRIVGFPSIILGVLVALLTYRIWTVAIVVVLAAIYTYRKILPKIIQREYETKAFTARNTFLNSMTSALTNVDKTVIEAINQILPRMDGELKIDMERLTLKLALGADSTTVHSLIGELINKYNEDKVFCQFLDQLETWIVEGTSNLKTLENLSRRHDTSLVKRDNYFRMKDTVLQGVKVMSSMIGGLILIFHGSSYLMTGSLEAYIDGFAKGNIGLVTATIYVIIYSRVMVQFFKQYYDDSIMELVVRTKK